jgi:hypothetical protein
MPRLTAATVLRWSFITICVAPYWLAVAWMIVDARANTQDVFAWLCCGLATMPWTSVVFVFEPAEENERAWLTAITASGAMLNGLLFALVVNLLSRGRRRRRTDPQAADHDDKRSDPP